MRTKILIACLAMEFLTLGQSSRAAGNRASVSPHTASFESTHRARQTHQPAALSPQDVSGVVPRAIRGGNPLEMLNPFAPAKYGTAQDNVSLDPDVPGKANGINLISFSF